jgi:hypothetical protein
MTSLHVVELEPIAVEKRKLVRNVTVKLSAGSSTAAVSSGFVRDIKGLRRKEKKVVSAPTRKGKLSAAGQRTATMMACTLAGLR